MNIGIILAGGSGTRMGSDIPKQFIDIYGKPMIIHTIESFDVNSEIDKIIVVCKDEWQEDLKIWIRKYGLNKVTNIVNGGSTRQESVYNALKMLEAECKDDDIVVIHDAARPLISQRIINENIVAAKKFGAVDTVIPSADTIVKSIDQITINEVPKRSELYLGQTPQSFTYKLIMDSHKKSIEDKTSNATDDCQLVLALNKDVHLVKGDKLNFKVTTFEDLLLLKSVIKISKVEVI